MSTAIKPDEFSDSVEVFKLKEKAITKEFLLGVIELGRILSEQKEIWKPQNRWYEYLERIGKQAVAANQMVRLFEYSIDHKKELLKSNLTNWNKVNLFLTLEDSEKESLADSIDGQEVTSDEFRDTVKKLKDKKGVSIETVSIPEEEDSVPFEPHDLFKGDVALLDEAILSKPELNIAELMKKIKKEHPYITQNSEGYLLAFFKLEKALCDLIVDSGRLSPDEKQFWAQQFLKVSQDWENFSNNLKK